MYGLFVKRAIDIIVSLFSLIVLMPLFFVVAILIKVKLGSPIIFKQYRPGKNNKIFKMYKFRSMTNERDESGDLLSDDMRLTKFGKMLRASSLDELPQLINVLIGDMSLIGPRPKLIKDIVFFNDIQSKRTLVRPGITGLAQVNGRNSNTWEQTIGYDIEYVEKMSFWQDVKILFKTIAVVFKKEGISTEGYSTHEYYGDYLVRTGQIDEEVYHKNLAVADSILDKVS